MAPTTAHRLRPRRTAASTQPRDPSKSFVAPYVREGMDGVAVIRPAAAFRHKGMDPLLALFHRELGEDLAMRREGAQGRHLPAGVLEASLPGYRVDYRRHRLRSVLPQKGRGEKHPSSTGEVDEPMHRISFGSLAVRMVAPVRLAGVPPPVAI